MRNRHQQNDGESHEWCGRSPLAGFTLIELLVTITIIAVLASAGFGAFQHARMLGKRSACASNMRQIGGAIVQHACENAGWMPTTAHTDAGESWIYQLEPILGTDFDRLRICPADPKAKERLVSKGTSYLLNEYTSVDLDDGLGTTLESYRNLTRLESPGETPIVFIASDTIGVAPTNDHTHSRNWRSWNSVIADIAPDRHRTGDSNNDHTQGSANYVFADGRVESLSADTLKERYFDLGINFACPPEGRSTP